MHLVTLGRNNEGKPVALFFLFSQAGSATVALNATRTLGTSDEILQLWNKMKCINEDFYHLEGGKSFALRHERPSFRRK